MTFNEIANCLDLLAEQAMEQITTSDRLRVDAEKRLRLVQSLQHEVAAAVALAEMAARANGSPTIDEQIAPTSTPLRAPFDAKRDAPRGQTRGGGKRRPLPPAVSGRNADIRGFMERVHEGAA